jgi:hypothetical protein
MFLRVNGLQKKIVIYLTIFSGYILMSIKRINFTIVYDFLYFHTDEQPYTHINKWVGCAFNIILLLSLYYIDNLQILTNILP